MGDNSEFTSVYSLDGYGFAQGLFYIVNKL